MSTPLLLGLTIGGVAFTAKCISKYIGKSKIISDLTGASYFTYFHKGGFEQKMSKREALLVLNLKNGASESEIKAAHRKIMLFNHPDRGGSPYIAYKVNEAKSVLEH